VIDIPTIEIIGTAVTVIAVAGVLLNNARRRACFLVWTISNSVSLAVHLMISPPLYSLAVRDAIFLALAIAGWIQWGRRTDQQPTANKEHPTSK